MPQTEDKKNLRDRRKLTGTQFGLNDIRTPTLHKIFAKKWGGGEMKELQESRKTTKNYAEKLWSRVIGIYVTTLMKFPWHCVVMHGRCCHSQCASTPISEDHHS